VWTSRSTLIAQSYPEVENMGATIQPHERKNTQTAQGETMVLKGHGWWVGPLQVAEILIRGGKKRQGTTSVVP
jgi:hypothetical protein